MLVGDASAASVLDFPVNIPTRVRVPSGVKIPVGRADLTLQPMMWMFLAILVTFLLTRTVTRLIRSGSGTGLGNVHIGGNHVHHQVFGILIIIGTGITLVSQTPRGAALDTAAAVFGVGIGLTVDEFALWLHLEDVYWAEQGRKSVDAIFCVLVITGTLIGGTSFATGRVGTAAWWSSVAVIALTLLLCVICLLKGKVVTGVVGIFFSPAALVGAVRLAKPGSWWATHRYAGRPRRAGRAARRFDQRHHDRWNWVRDLVAGAPSREGSGEHADGRASLPPAARRVTARHRGAAQVSAATCSMKRAEASGGSASVLSWSMTAR